MNRQPGADAVIVTFHAESHAWTYSAMDTELGGQGFPPDGAIVARLLSSSSSIS
jgi:hypothetical protein